MDFAISTIFEGPNPALMIGSLCYCRSDYRAGMALCAQDILQYVSDRLNTTSYFRRA